MRDARRSQSGRRSAFSWKLVVKGQLVCRNVSDDEGKDCCIGNAVALLRNDNDDDAANDSMNHTERIVRMLVLGGGNIFLHFVRLITFTVFLRIASML